MEELAESGLSHRIPRLQIESIKRQSNEENCQRNIEGLLVEKRFDASTGGGDQFDSTNALDYWLRGLSFEVDDYESSDIMMTKCISGTFSSCCFDSSSSIAAVVNRSGCYELDKLKVEILSKCFASIWDQPTENDILKGLYVFLNEIFSTYFRKNSTHTHFDQSNGVIENDCGSDKSRVGDVIVKRQRKMRQNFDPVSRRLIDKKATQKLETFILSTTLNRATIKYENCMKFYFALEASQTLKCLATSDRKNILTAARFIALENSFHLRLRTRKQFKEFIKLLKLILLRASSKVAIKESPPSDTKDLPSSEEENIYSPIWKCYTVQDCPAVVPENIYAPLDFASASDDKDWESASGDFYFVDVPKKMSSSTDIFSRICILYSDQNTELNKILYSYDSCGVVNDASDQLFSSHIASDKAPQPLETSRNFVNEPASESKEPDSVKAWKVLLREALYLEDEEDVVSCIIKFDSMILA